MNDRFRIDGRAACFPVIHLTMRTACFSVIHFTMRAAYFSVIRTACLAAVLLAIFLLPGIARSQPSRNPYPEEPERYASEYYLDMLTMRYDRHWRDARYARDNIYCLRFGSLNVEQWRLEERLKLAADLSDRFRFRFWMDADRGLEETWARRGELELEGRICGDFYASLYLSPSFWKRENDIGMGFQRRTGVDRFVRVTARILDFANNFAYEHGDNIEGEENLYTKQPFEFELEAREEIGEAFRFGAIGALTTRWEREYRFLEGQAEDRLESGYRRDGCVWAEFDAGSSFVLGLEARSAEFAGETSNGDGTGEMHRIREFLPDIWWYPSMERRMALNAGLQIRRERWSGEGSERYGDFSKEELLPFVLFQYGFNDTHGIEFGYLGDRYESNRTGDREETVERWENRLKLVYELKLKGLHRFRVIETIDLDREDWGQFSIHDHFFIMMMIAF